MATQSHIADRLRVATFDVWGLPEPLGRDLRRRAEAIGRGLGELDLDVIAFQEVWAAELRDILIGAGYDAGLPHFWYCGDLF